LQEEQKINDVNGNEVILTPGIWVYILWTTTGYYAFWDIEYTMPDVDYPLDERYIPNSIARVNDISNVIHFTE
jgi:hypothetical protein